MKNLIDVIKLSTDYLQKKGIQSPRRQAEELIADALKLKRLELYLQFDRPLSDAELDLCRSRLTRRANGEPSQYIRGEVEFLNCNIKVSPAVLIPRQETEILVDMIVKHLSQQDLKGKTLWDVCCGSGCIGIAIKKKLPDLNVILSDVSVDALKLSQENAQRNGVEVTCVQGDLLQPLEGKRTNFLVCNPPYVSESEFKNLTTEVSKYEPRLALVSGPSGLEFYERLADKLDGVLEPHGKAWLEIGTGQGAAVKQLFSKSVWNRCDFEQDWGGHDRFFFLEIE
jgi:release factor glutamine methyltransferase